MRRSQADSINRSLAVFGKLQHILPAGSLGTSTSAASPHGVADLLRIELCTHLCEEPKIDSYIGSQQRVMTTLARQRLSPVIAAGDLDDRIVELFFDHHDRRRSAATTRPSTRSTGCSGPDRTART